MINVIKHIIMENNKEIKPMRKAITAYLHGAKIITTIT